MKVCCTQPACPCSTPSFNVVALALSRNAFASAAVGAGFDAVSEQPVAATQAAARIKFLIVMV